MAYLNGVKTVYCRSCGTKGHNRRTCPEIPREQKVREESLYPRSCSWCRQSGHDVRHCEVKVAEYQAWYQANIKVRQASVELMNKQGFTPGALLIPAFEIEGKKYAEYPIETVPTKYMMMVDRIAWDKMLSTEIPHPKGVSWRKRNREKNCVCTRQPVHLTAMGRVEPDEEYDYHFSEETWIDIEGGAYSWRGNYKVGIPSAPVKWEDLPESFRNGTSGTDKLWKKNK